MNPERNPLISFVILAFNQDKFIRQAIEGALTQTYSPLEIIISDDASQDSTATIIKEMVASYRGPHKVIVNINDKNLGIGGHINNIFEMMSGELVVLAAGDDISLPVRTERIVRKWLERDRIPSAIYCGADVIDDSGNHIAELRTALRDVDRSAATLISYNRKTQLLMGACSAYTRDVYWQFGPLFRNLGVEDIPLTVRASLLGGIEFVDERLVLYRKNVSVWLPRKLPNEDFARHSERMAYRIRVNHRISSQLLDDVRKSDSFAALRAAHRRYLATEFALQTMETRHFSAMRYLKLILKTPHWFNAIFPSILFSFPKSHNWLFKIKNHRMRNMT